MEISHHINSLFSSASYRIEGMLVDVGDSWRGFIDVKAVLLTHAHFDHIYGLNDILDLYPEIKVYTNTVGKDMLLDPKKNLSYYHETPFSFKYPQNIVTVDDGEELLPDGQTTVRAIFTPGHNGSCITWITEDAIFTGDSYIPGVKTVTNLPGGNRKLAEKSKSIIKNLINGKRICPGHIIIQ